VTDKPYESTPLMALSTPFEVSPANRTLLLALLVVASVALKVLDAFKEIHKIGKKYMKSEWYLRLANFPKAGVFTMLDPREHGPHKKLLSRSLVGHT
jgi:hypothetical protein